MEIHYFLTKRILQPKSLANGFLKYKCKNEIGYAEEFFESVILFLGKKLVFKTSESVIYWLKNHIDLLYKISV